MTTAVLVVALLLALALLLPHSASGKTARQMASPNTPRGVKFNYGPQNNDKVASNVLLLDHINLNHEKGRHDLLRAFYLDTLGLALDPRKKKNFDEGRDSLWFNAGITQLHLPEAERAQVFDGVITLSCTGAADTFSALIARLEQPPAVLLRDSYFSWCRLSDKAVAVRDPWGTSFVLKHDPSALDTRGKQPDADTALLPCTISDVTVNLPRGTSAHDLLATASFYQHTFETPWTTKRGSFDDTYRVSLQTSPVQHLSFQRLDDPIPDALRTKLDGDEEFSDIAARLQAGCARPAPTPHAHDDVERAASDPAPSSASSAASASTQPRQGKIIANAGPHISLYVQDFSGIYARAERLGCLFTNTRFERQAYSLAEARQQCMFRTFDVQDPASPDAARPLLRLEHEVRSVLDKDGKLYKSCPFDAVPPGFRP